MKLLLTTFVILLLAVGRVDAVQLPSALSSLGVNVHFETPDVADLDMIQAAGMKYVRADLSWSSVEPSPGYYSFANAHQLAQACADRGLRLQWNMSNAPAFYGDDYTSPAWQQAFTNYAIRAANVLKGQNAVYEIISEPQGHWKSLTTNEATRATEYTTFMKQLIPTIRQIDPTAAIIGPGVCAGNENDIWMNTCMQQGLLNYIDGVSYHPYRAGAPENMVTAGVNGYNALRSKINSYGSNLPICTSELGYALENDVNPLTPETQGDYAARLMLVNISQNMPLTMWYRWRDYTGYPEHFGLVGGNLEKNPAYNEIQELTSSLQGTTFTRRITSTNWWYPDRDWILEFTSPNGEKTLAAWTTGSSRSVNLSGWGTIDLTSTPTYINPVPEPSACVLLITAVLGIGAYVWRIQK